MKPLCFAGVLLLCGRSMGLFRGLALCKTPRTIVRMGAGENSMSVKGPKVVRERIQDIDNSILLSSEVSKYGLDIALAEEHMMMGNYGEAERLAKEAMEIAEHTHQQNNIYAAYAEGILGRVLFAEGHYKEAAEKMGNALEMYERHYESPSGPQAVELLGATSLLAKTFLSKKEYMEAQEAFAVAMGISGKLQGLDSYDVALAMSNLATAYVKGGDLGTIPEALYKKALHMLHEERHKMQVTGEVHVESEEVDGVPENIEVDLERVQANFDGLQAIYCNLGNLYFTRGEDVMAEAAYLKFLDFSTPEGSHHVAFVPAIKNLATIHWRAGLVHKAESLVKKALRMLDQSPQHGSQHEASLELREMLSRMETDREPNSDC